MLHIFKDLTGGDRHNKKGEKSCKFIKRKVKHDYNPIAYLYEHVLEIWTGHYYITKLQMQLVGDVVQ